MESLLLIRGEMVTIDRRNFLKVSGLVAANAVLSSEDLLQAEVKKNEGRPASDFVADPVDLVNVLQGAHSTVDFSKGNTLPIAALPFGMAHWTLQSHDDTPWMFQSDLRRLQGFRCTHQLSPWLGDYGQATFLPFCGEVHPDAASRSSSYLPGSAILRPYSLQLFLLRYRAYIELVPTERCSIITASFEPMNKPKASGFIFDIPGTMGTIEPDPELRRIRFTSSANSGGVPEGFATYYIVEFGDKWDSFEIKGLGSHKVGIIRFQTGQSIEARVATSFISFEQAALNMQKELGGRSVEAVREEAKLRWNDHLQKIEVEGATEPQCTVFYSCMYRTLLFPRIWHEPDANGEMHHYSPYNGMILPGVMYADHGYWDVYRAWYPYMSILFPERLGEILQAWVNAYKEGGWFPQFPAPGYRACMTGSLIDSVFGDAVVKGIGGFNLEDAYEGLKKHATEPGDPAKGYGRRGIEQYLKLHYVPADKVAQSVAETVDAAYGDFCIAQVAKTLNKQEDYKYFLERSENWRYVFDAKVKFLRGKNEDGLWLEPFDQFAWGNAYVEGSAWQHRWDVPQNIPGLIAAMGGNAKAAEYLERMLTLPPIFDVGSYGIEIHEMSEMAAVPFGQYAQSNQPVHHLLYIFSHAGRPDRTQFWARKVMDELYSPDVFPGDEDTGSMSAWFILSALGFYPVCPGKPEYTLGSPLFPRATLHLPQGKTLIIEATGNHAEAVFVKEVWLDGQSYSRKTLDHSAIANGGSLRFQMGEAV